jgi:hypothetical protein
MTKKIENPFEQLARAKALYVKRATQAERDRLRVLELQAANLLDQTQRARVKKSIPELKRKLELAAKGEGEIFDAVISGQVEP